MKIAINLSCLSVDDHRSDLRHSSYDEYQAAQIDDEPDHKLFEFLAILGQGAEITVYTTMREAYSYQVNSWLINHRLEADDVLFRPDDDYSRTAECVVEMLDGQKFDIVIDNHPETCDALREEGFKVLEVG